MNSKPNQTPRYKITKRFCCTFHAEGGSPDLSCGGDHPDIGGTHLRDCAYHGGGDCTCGRGVPDDGRGL